MTRAAGARSRERAGSMGGLELDVRLFAGANDDWLGTAGTLGLTWWAGRGRLRWGAGAELGYARLDELDTDHRIPGLVLGARASALVDVLRFTGPKGRVDLFLRADVGAATPRLYQGAAFLGIRLADRALVRRGARAEPARGAALC